MAKMQPLIRRWFAAAILIGSALQFGVGMGSAAYAQPASPKGATDDRATASQGSQAAEPDKSGELSTSSRGTIIEKLRLQAGILQSQGETDDAIREALRTMAIRQYVSATDLEDSVDVSREPVVLRNPANNKVVESLIAEAFPQGADDGEVDPPMDTEGEGEPLSDQGVQAAGGGPRAEDRQTIVNALRLSAGSLRLGGLQGDALREKLRTMAIPLFASAIGLTPDARGDFALRNPEHKKVVESLLDEALQSPRSTARVDPEPVTDAQKAKQDQPSTRPGGEDHEEENSVVTHPELSENLLAIIFRAAQFENERLQADRKLDDAARNRRLTEFIEGRLVAALDRDLEADDRTVVTRLQADVLAGKSGLKLQAPVSRLTPELLQALNRSIRARSRELIVGGVVPGSIAHLDLLQDFAEEEARAGAKIEGELKDDEPRQVAALVRRVLIPDDMVFPEPIKDGSQAQSQVAPDLRQRILSLLRQINEKLAPIGLDSSVRRAVLVKFVRERFSEAAGIAEELADEVIQRGPVTSPPPGNPVPSTVVQMPVTTMVPQSPLFLIVNPRQHFKPCRILPW